MKKIFTLLTAIAIGNIGFGQVIFQSDFSSWSGGNPTDWMGSKTNITPTDVVEVATGAVYGTSYARLINTATGHKRVTTQPLTVVNGQAYEIKFWAKGQGDIRTGLFDDHMPTSTSGYLYNAYITINSGAWTEYSQNITATNNLGIAEFILSVRNTVAPNHLEIDSVSITAVVLPPPALVSIYDIQYTTASPANSPLEGQIVTTVGVVTGIIQNGLDSAAYFIQDGTGSWNGLYIYDTDAVVAIGDSVEVTGEVDEFNFLTEIKNVTAYTVINSGNTLPVATTVSTLNAGNEEYEGVLIHVASGQCTTTSEGFGLWSIDDNSGVIRADDDIFYYHLTAVVGNWYSVTGIGHYSFGAPKILPRSLSDISTTGFASIEENNTFSFYPNPASTFVTMSVNENATVRIYAMSGALVYEGLGQKLIDVSSFNSGMYHITVTEDSITSSQKLVIQ